MHALNEKLGNVGTTVVHVPCAAAEPVDRLASLRELTEAMRGGQVETLVLSGTNPVYTAPADLEFGAALQKVAFKVHHGLYRDETSAFCDWHVPDAHPLEAWGDVRSLDGTLSLRQPCIAPLYDGHSDLELFGALNGDLASSGRDLLLAFWRKQRSGDFDAFLDAALRTGVVANSASAPVTPSLIAQPQPLATARATSAPAPAPAPAPLHLHLHLHLRLPAPRRLRTPRRNQPTSSSCSYPTRACMMDVTPTTRGCRNCRRHCHSSPGATPRCCRPRWRIDSAVVNEDVLELRVGDRSVAAPAWVMPGMPDNSVSLALGYGRSAAGKVGNGRGVDAYLLRTTAAPWIARGITVSPTGKRQPLACVQPHHSMEGRDIVRSYTLPMPRSARRRNAARRRSASSERCTNRHRRGPMHGR